jgi:2-(1,2-epoxy-1,2-dihydrophenyl)acetyl-CoA isomerase
MAWKGQNSVTYQLITTEQRGRVGIVTLNRPEKLNAWNYEMHAELSDAITRWNEDPGVGAIVMTGAGRGFCAGADISNFQRQIDAADKGDSTRTSAERVADSYVDFARSSKPLIAAVNGVAVGIGMTLILPFDVRIASWDARFGFFFVKMGLLPELESTYFLPQIVGLGNASELLLSGRLIDANEALRVGLISRVVGPDDLLSTAVAIGEEIAANPTPQLLWIKELLAKNAVEPDNGKVRKREGKRLDKARKTPEHREAVSAFLEKRQPVFAAQKSD